MKYLLVHHFSWETTSYIFTSIGAIATSISLIYLFIKDYSKSKKISHLERVAETLETDLQLKYQPHLWINGISLKGGENKVEFDLNNKGMWCKLLEFNILSGDLIFDEVNKHLPYELERKFDEGIISTTNRRWIFMINNSNKHINDVEYKFEVVYVDRLNKKYSITVEGKGASKKLSYPKLVN